MTITSLNAAPVKTESPQQTKWVVPQLSLSTNPIFVYKNRNKTVTLLGGTPAQLLAGEFTLNLQPSQMVGTTVKKTVASIKVSHSFIASDSDSLAAFRELLTMMMSTYDTFVGSSGVLTGEFSPSPVFPHNNDYVSFVGVLNGQ